MVREDIRHGASAIIVPIGEASVMSTSIAQRLAGRVALVTGAARGNGWAIARGLAEAGAAVTLADIDGDAAEERARELVARGDTARGLALDVADTTAVRQLVGQVAEAFGRIDV